MMGKSPSVSLLFQEDPWVYKILQIVSSDKVCVCAATCQSHFCELCFPKPWKRSIKKRHEKPSLPYTWVPTIHVIFISWLCIKIAWEDWNNPSVQAPAQPKGDRHSTGTERCLFSNSSGNFEQQRLRTPALFAWCPKLPKLHSNPETREVQDGKQTYLISAWVPTPSGKYLFHGEVQQSRLEHCGLGHFWKSSLIYTIFEDNCLKSMAGMPEYRAPGSMFFLWLPNPLPCVYSGVWTSIVLEHACLNNWTSYSTGSFSWLRKRWVVYFLIFVPLWGISHLKNIYVE